MQVANIEESLVGSEASYYSATKNKPKELRIALDNDDSLCPGICILCCEAKFKLSLHMHVFSIDDIQNMKAINLFWYIVDDKLKTRLS